GPRSYRTTSYPVMGKNGPPSLAFGTPGRIWMVCRPGVGQRQANRTGSGRLRPELAFGHRLALLGMAVLLRSADAGPGALQTSGWRHRRTSPLDHARPP